MSLFRSFMLDQMSYLYKLIYTGLTFRVVRLGMHRR